MNFYYFLLLYFFLIPVFTTPLWSHDITYELDPEVHRTSDIPFQVHEGHAPLSHYLSMEIPFAPIAHLRSQIEKSHSQKLKHRGEAHITIITPVEYTQVLKEKISIHEINQIAMNAHVQSSKFNILCLGEGKAKQASTFYVIVSSTELLNLRVAIHQLFISRGGNPSAFNPHHYYPHITVGYTERDLHEADGIIKNKNTCIGTIIYRNDNPSNPQKKTLSLFL